MPTTADQRLLLILVAGVFSWTCSATLRCIVGRQAPNKRTLFNTPAASPFYRSSFCAPAASWLFLGLRLIGMPGDSQGAQLSCELLCCDAAKLHQPVRCCNSAQNLHRGVATKAHTLKGIKLQVKTLSTTKKMDFTESKVKDDYRGEK